MTGKKKDDPPPKQQIVSRVPFSFANANQHKGEGNLKQTGVCMIHRLIKSPIAYILAIAVLFALAILFLKPRRFLMGSPA